MLVIGSMAATDGHAACRYFRVKYKLLLCQIEKSLPTAANRGESDDPALTDDPAASNGPLVTVRCGCDYTLYGSAPQCDFDKSEERTGVLPPPEDRVPCPRGQETCSDICPRQLTD